MKMHVLLHSDIDDIEDLRGLLSQEEFQIHSLSKKEDIFREIAKGYLDIIFLGQCCSSSHKDIIQSITKIKELDPRLAIICIGPGENREMAIEIIKQGATACFNMPLDGTAMLEMIDRIRDKAQQRKEIYEYENALHDKYTFSDMVSKNPGMIDIFSLITRVAPYFRNMLITGDTGTGKEVLARALHNLGPSSQEPFIVCNCSGLVEHLIESELFGHVKGAFTGAVSNKAGLFEAAGNGTIVLDEIGDMPVNFQPHLLRVLQDGEFRRVGSTETMKARCRVIALTNADLKEKINQGLFREDLYFRLAVINIELPSLRERKEDIPLLCRYFLKKFREKIGKKVAGISMPAQRCLMSYNWQGNIRELENTIERAILLTTVNFIRPQDLPPSILHGQKEDIINHTIDELVKNHIAGVLRTTKGNKTTAASILGISRRALQRKMEKYGL